MQASKHPVSHPYWLEVKPKFGSRERPRDGEILIIGSGLSGASCAYWLQQVGFSDLTLVDFELEKAATFRNCGHILYGTVESMQAMVALHGPELAKEVWGFSVQICHEVRDTIRRLNLEADYRQDGYLVVAIDETEDREIQASVKLLNDMGFHSSYCDAKRVRAAGFRNCYGARFEEGSAQAHPVKFRNGLLEHCVGQGLKYHSGVEVLALEEESDGVRVETAVGKLHYDAVIVAGNAYSPLFSDFFARYRLVEPFRGQIITSRPLQQRFKVKHPHSFDHGYEYALITPDNRLMIGGWRNHTSGGEVGTYDITPNAFVEEGLKEFVREHYDMAEDPSWEFSWAGIMAASKTGFPFIGPTHSPRIYACAGYTGHGFSWAHGSAKVLADIIAGNPIPSVARLFNPRQI